MSSNTLSSSSSTSLPSLAAPMDVYNFSSDRVWGTEESAVTSERKSETWRAGGSIGGSAT